MKKFEDFLKENDKDSVEKNIRAKAKESGIPYKELKDVFDQGMRAWQASGKGKGSPYSWGYGRVNAYIKGDPDVR